LNEIVSGETRLASENGKVIRYIQVLVMDVYYQSPGGLLQLKEDRQVFKNGSVRRRDYLGTSLNEKCRTDENMVLACRRVVLEELQIDDPSLIYFFLEAKTNKPSISPSYPGLLSINTTHHYRVTLPIKHYRPEGYEEVQEDKTTYFVWVPAWTRI
jgi:hypothetical protein